MLSLPMFAIMPHSVRRGFVGLSRPKNLGGRGGSSYYDGHNNPLLTTTATTKTNLSLSSSIIRKPYTMLALNLLSQLICVAGVNQLSSVRTFFFPSPSLLSPDLFQKNQKPPISPCSLARSHRTAPHRSSLSPFVKIDLVTRSLYFNFFHIQFYSR